MHLGERNPLTRCGRDGILQLEPILARTHDLDRRRDRLQLATRFLESRADRNVPAPRQRRIIESEEANDPAGIAQLKRVRAARKTGVLESRERFLFRLEIADEKAVRVCGIAKDETFFRIG